MRKSTQTMCKNYMQMTNRNRLLPVLLAFLGFILAAMPAAANGIPVQVFLDHLPFKATWQPAAAARGVAVVSANDEQVRVMAQNLPAPPADQIYYAWLEETAGGFLPVGALVYQSDGTASLDQHIADLPYSENFAWVLISVEAAGDISTAPSLDIALAGRLPNALALPPAGSEAPALLPVTGGQTGSLHSMSLFIVLSLLFAAGLYTALRRQHRAGRLRRARVHAERRGASDRRHP